MDIANIARVCHEAIRAYCACHEDYSQRGWEEAPDWQKDSAIYGVVMHKSNPKATHQEIHENWCEEKRKNGWVYGKSKNEDEKTHPCLVPYEELPIYQKQKDILFSAICKALSNIE